MLISAAMLVPLFVLGFAGMWISRKRPGTREVVILFTILMLFVTAVHTVTRQYDAAQAAECRSAC